MKVLGVIVLLLAAGWGWLFLSNQGILVSSKVVTEDRVGKFTESLGIQGMSVPEKTLICTYFSGLGTTKRTYSLMLGDKTCLNVIDLRQ
ncbi:MAG TPA: hypothetical protein VIW02_02515 [Gammaproteobacteria bacterium]